MTAVAWLPARGDLLLALFTFLTMISFIKLIETGGLRFYLLHFLCFALAIFSKESAVVLPLLLAVYVWAYSKKALLTKRMMLLPVYYAAVQLAYFTLKSKAVVSYERDIGVLSFIKNLRTFPEMVARFYVPVNMSTLPAFKLYATLTGILLLAGLTTLHVYARRKLDRQVLFACAWFVLFIVPAMTYFPVFYYFAFEHVDHRAYVTCFGLLLLNLNLIQRFELDSLKYFRHVVLLLLAYLTALNLYFSRNYRDPSAFALRAIKTNPKSAQAFSLYGNELYLQGREDEALENLSRSIRILRKFMPALHTRALIYRGRGLNREALADLDTLLATDPGYSPDDYSLRGYIRIDLEDYAGAMADFSSALRLKPDHAEALKALEELRRTVRNNQLLPEVKSALEYNRSGLEAAGRGDFAAAAGLFRKALLSDPGCYEVNLNLGNSLYELGRKDEACAAWEVAAAHGNDSSAGRLKQYCQR
jgi:tetratricopeptide (TPR) repeat protein